MLLNNFFTIKKTTEISDNEIFVEVSINPKHKIFDGHFPNNPVVPGVVSVQMLNEILSQHLGFELINSNAKSIKFSAMINPLKNPKLNFKIKYSKLENASYKVNASIIFEETTFLKFIGNFNKFAD